MPQPARQDERAKDERAQRQQGDQKEDNPMRTAHFVSGQISGSVLRLQT
jgi:hypothetical protein